MTIAMFILGIIVIMRNVFATVFLIRANLNGDIAAGNVPLPILTTALAILAIINFFL